MISTPEYGPFHELETLLIALNSGTGASANEQGVIGDLETHSRVFLLGQNLSEHALDFLGANGSMPLFSGFWSCVKPLKLGLRFAKPMARHHLKEKLFFSKHQTSKSN